MLETLPQLANTLSQPPLGSASSPSAAKTSNYHYLSKFLSTLTPLTTSHPILFAPHLQTLLAFLPSLILPPVDCGPTPTMGRPFPAGGGRQGAFVFPPSDSSSATNGEDEGADQDQDEGDDDLDLERDERSTLRLSALEFMISLSESRPNMVKKVPGWTEIIVRACLEGMGELEDEDEGLDGWLKEDVCVFFFRCRHFHLFFRCFVGPFFTFFTNMRFVLCCDSSFCSTALHFRYLHSHFYNLIISPYNPSSTVAVIEASLTDIPLFIFIAVNVI